MVEEYAVIRRAVCLAATSLRAVLLTCGWGLNVSINIFVALSVTRSRASGCPSRYCTLIRECSRTILARATPCCGPCQQVHHTVLLSHASVRQAFFLGSSIILQAMGACPPCRPSCSQLSLDQRLLPRAPQLYVERACPKTYKPPEVLSHAISWVAAQGRAWPRWRCVLLCAKGLGVGVLSMLCSSHKHVVAPQLRRAHKFTVELLGRNLGHNAVKCLSCYIYHVQTIVRCGSGAHPIALEMMDAVSRYLKS